MTDSTIDRKSSDGAVELGPSVDELFGDLEDESLEGEPVDRTATDESDETVDTDGIEDTTAADVFNQLRADADDADTTTVLEGDDPEDIIASAGEPDDTDEFENTDLDADFLVDEDALDDLLLTDRTKADEFLWVDHGDDSSLETERDGETETRTGTEIESELETEPALDSETLDEPYDDRADETTDDLEETETSPALEIDGTEFETVTDFVESVGDDGRFDGKLIDDSEFETITEFVESLNDDESAEDREFDAITSFDSVDDFMETVEEERSARADATDGSAEDSVDGARPSGRESNTVTQTDPEPEPRTKSETLPVPADDEDSSSGVLGWIRSKVGRFF